MPVKYLFYTLARVAKWKCIQRKYNCKKKGIVHATAFLPTLAAKKAIWKQKELDDIAIALAHFIFRDGPIEDIHAGPNSKLTNEETSYQSR